MSILIPVYNVDRYLDACLSSITPQLERGVEIVIVDDASTDDSATILRRFEALLGSALVAFRLTKNSGLAAARNRLLREARGEYCWFVDGDDVMCAGAIRSLHRIIKSGSIDLVLCDFRVEREHFALKHRLRGEAHRSTFVSPSSLPVCDKNALIHGILMSGQLHPWTKIARRSIWQGVRFPEGRYFEDIAALPQLIRSVRSHVHVAEPWIGYRQREGSILSQITPQKIRDQLLALSELRSILCDASAVADDGTRFALNHFVFRSHASLARRLAEDFADDAADLRREVRESLQAFFPKGSNSMLLAYLQRGWFLRAWRAHRSLQSIGVRFDAR